MPKSPRYYWSPTTRKSRKPKNFDWLKRHYYEITSKQRDLVDQWEAVESSNGWCVVRAPGCTGRAVVGHHRAYGWPRPSEVEPACDNCHYHRHFQQAAANDNEAQLMLDLLDYDETQKQSDDELMELYLDAKKDHDDA